MTPEPVLLVAGGGLARETLSAIRASGKLAPIGILDDDLRTHGSMVGGIPVLGGTEAVVDFPDARVVVCAGRGQARQKIVQKLAALRVGRERFATVIHPAAIVADCSVIGGGSIVLGGAVATADVRVGEHVVVMPNAVLTHDVAIDDFATICAAVALAGAVMVGRAAYLGTNASVRQGVSVGVESTLGMGAVLLQDLPAGETWVGSPARAIVRSQVHQ